MFRIRNVLVPHSVCLLHTKHESRIQSFQFHQTLYLDTYESKYPCSVNIRTKAMRYNFKNRHALILPRPETNYSRNSIAYRGVTLCNSLPANIKSADGIGNFEALLKKKDLESFKFDKLMFLNTFKNPLYKYF